MIILFPGKFKPAHPGHIKKILAYAKDPGNKVYVIISPSPKDGIQAKTSRDFLTMVFSKYPNVFISIAQTPSPVQYAYITANDLAKYGPNEFKLISSGKDNDMKRSVDFYKMFTTKYKNPNITPILPDEHDNDILLDFGSKPYSSTDIRQLLLNADLRTFKDIYGILSDMRLATVMNIENYFNFLRNDMRYASVITESTAISHISHPYEYSDFTFEELKSLISDICNNKIENITEKIDGISLYASVDEAGIPIFARNMTQLTKSPLYADDILTNRRFGAMGISGVFERAIKSINTVFMDLPSEYFNHPHNDVIERTWISMEIVAKENRNIVKYDNDFISIHGCKSVQYTRNNTMVATMDEGLVDNDLINAILDSYQNHTDVDMIIRLTPKVSINAINPDKYISKLNNLMTKYNFNDDCTIGDYKVAYFNRYIRDLRAFAAVDGEALRVLMLRWAYGKNGKTLAQTLSGVTNLDGHVLDGKTLNLIGRFEKNDMKVLEKDCMKPLKELFMDLGNAVLNALSGTISVNSRNDKMRIRNAVRTAKNRFDRGFSIDDKEFSDYSDKMLNDVEDISSSEGIVFVWNGRKMKITGYYPLLNRMIGFENE